MKTIRKTLLLSAFAVLGLGMSSQAYAEWGPYGYAKFNQSAASGRQSQNQTQADDGQRRGPALGVQEPATPVYEPDRDRNYNSDTATYGEYDNSSSSED